LDAFTVDKEVYAKEHTYRSWVLFSEEWKYFSKHNGVEPLFAHVRYRKLKEK